MFIASMNLESGLQSSRTTHNGIVKHKSTKQNLPLHAVNRTQRLRPTGAGAGR